MASSKGVAIVTGAGQGIGRGIALRLAEDGYDISLNDISSNKKNLDEVAAEIQIKGRRVLNVLGDVSNEDDVKDIVSRTVVELGSLDVVSARGHNEVVQMMRVDRLQDGRERGNSVP